MFIICRDYGNLILIIWQKWTISQIKILSTQGAGAQSQLSANGVHCQVMELKFSWWSSMSGAGAHLSGDGAQSADGAQVQ